MKKQFFMLVMASAFLLITCSNSGNIAVTNTNLQIKKTLGSIRLKNDEQYGIMAKNMLDIINKTRSEGCVCGGEKMPAVPKLAYNFLLEKAAIAHSKDMAKNKFMSHTGSDGSTFTTRVNRTGYKYRAVAENVAARQASVTTVMNSWLSSPGHCKNIMNSNYKEVGFGMTNIGGDNYWTQVFGTQM